VRVRNVPTNIRDWADGTEYDGNSIFVFEIAGLCIAHLGHLHHTLEPSQLRKLGRIDVLLVPVDGSYTLDLAGMMEVLRDIDARLMIPMHFFGPATLARFLDKPASATRSRTRRPPPSSSRAITSPPRRKCSCFPAFEKFPEPAPSAKRFSSGRAAVSHALACRFGPGQSDLSS
jgi:hypothetical protein